MAATRILLPGVPFQPTQEDTAAVVRRTWRTTLCVVLGSAAVAVGLAAFELRAAMLPAAFILGWLNLAGQ
jgi:hypothetical protein